MIQDINTTGVDRAALTTAAVPSEGFVMVPVELAKRVQESLGEFLMDHGWSQLDMDTSDDFGTVLLAAAPKAEPVPETENPVSQPAGEYPPLPLPDFGRARRLGAAYYGDAYTADQMRAYADATCAMRAQAAPTSSASVEITDEQMHQGLAAAFAHPRAAAPDAVFKAGVDFGVSVALLQTAPTTQATPQPAVQHPDDAAVDALAMLMKAKLAKQRAKGYGGWDSAECKQEWLSALLREHVIKGDPVDVANFCAFLSARGEVIAPSPAEDLREAEMLFAKAPQPAVQQGWDIDAAVEKAWGRFQAAMDKDEPLPPPSIHATAHYGTWLGREAHRHDEPKAGAFRNAARMLAVLEAEIRRLHAELIAAQSAAPVAQGDAEDAARYRYLKSQASEQLLNPRAALSEICPDMRTHWKLPTLICSGPVGGYLDFDASIDAVRSQDKQGANHD